MLRQRTEATKDRTSALSLASQGYGPLLQRDYWCVIERCRFRPTELIDLVAARFPEFAPEDIVLFRRGDGGDTPLRVGDEVEVRIRAAGSFRVRVVHRDAQSFTVATIRGHPEAGRITFGAYRNAHGDVIFHIRSRARSSTVLRWLGFRTAGEAMQTYCWTDFVNRVALTTGEGLIGPIHAETRRIPDEPERVLAATPTFLARGE